MEYLEQAAHVTEYFLEGEEAEDDGERDGLQSLFLVEIVDLQKEHSQILNVSLHNIPRFKSTLRL